MAKRNITITMRDGSEIEAVAVRTSSPVMVKSGAFLLKPMAIRKMITVEIDGIPLMGQKFSSLRSAVKQIKSSV